MKFFKKYITVLAPDQKKDRNKDLLLGLLSGILLGLSYPPIPLPFLSFVSLIPFLFVLKKRETLLSINRFFYVTIFFFNLITLYWVGSWTKEADTFLMISGVVLLFLNPLFYLIITTLYHFSKKLFGKKNALFLFPFYWVSFEFLYSLTDLRFPWLTLGNSTPYFKLFIQISDIIGVYGLSLIILFINILLYLSLTEIKSKKKLNYKYLSFALILFLLVITYGLLRTNSFIESNQKIKIGLVQPHFNPWSKWQNETLESQLNIYIKMSEQAIEKGAKLILWPESALPVYLLSGNYDYEVSRIRQLVNSNNIILMTGMPDANYYFNKNGAPKDVKKTRSGILYTSYNSILMFQPYLPTVEKYGKIKLVPFGEHVPFVEQLPFLGDFIKWEVGISSWNVGKDQVVFELYKKNNSIVKIAGVICIESIYPEFVAGFIQKGADLIAVVTNDSWYGYSSGPFQHKEISVLRAVENRKSVIRAANGGISCIIDPLGNTIATTKLFTRDIIVGDVVINKGKTFYSNFPWIFPMISSFISIVTIMIFLFKKILTKTTNKHEKNY